jgi:hypothetical protein
MLQAWYTCIWGVYLIILLLFSTDPLKLNQVGWGASLRCYFQVSPEMFDRVQVRALAEPLKDILVLKPLLRCLGCVLRMVVHLKGEPSPKSEVLSALVQIFIKALSVLCAIFLSFDSD